MRFPWIALALGACAADSAPDPTATAAAVTTCALHACEPSIGGQAMFSAQDFAAISDRFGRNRMFYVHIPARYDSLTSGEKMPLIFALHGGGEDRQAMIDGKWDAYFEQDYAFVIPLGEDDPCAAPKRQWLIPTLSERAAFPGPDCPAGTAQAMAGGGTTTYWRTSIADTFTDVQFIEDLRAAVLARFPNLNPNKVYATGFSAGGGLTLALACYRSDLFRAFSAVGKELGTQFMRGDYNNTGATDADSLLATCGLNQLSMGHATGIADPQLWGTGLELVTTPTGPYPVPVTRVRPVALFFGDNDIANKGITGEPAYTTEFVRGHNNLDTGFTYQNNYVNAPNGTDNVTTQRRTYTGSVGGLPSAALRRFQVSVPTGTSAPTEAMHAIPDIDRCTGTFMTCDYNYTDETIAFWQNQADLNLVP